MENFEEIFEFIVIDEKATIPSRKRETDAGYDIGSIVDFEILPGEFASIPTGLQISAPSGWYYTLEARSGMLLKGLSVSRGIIDATYTGDIYIIMHNHSKETYEGKAGDRIAQIIPQKIRSIKFLKKGSFSPEYDIRGKSGWGSSGK